MDHDIQSDRSTRDHILSVSARLFSERGFANVSIRDICEVAEVTPPTIYHYYGNKDGLFKDVIRRTLSLRDFKESLARAVEGQPDPEAQLHAFIHHYLSSFPRHFFNPGMFLQDSTTLSGLSTERVMSEFEEIDSLAKRIIQSGVESGLFRKLDAVQVKVYLMNLLMAFVLSEVHYNQPHDPDEAANFVFDLFVNGIRNQP